MLSKTVMFPILVLIQFVAVGRCVYFSSKEAKHLFVSPSRLVSGSSNKLCFSRFGSAVYGNVLAHVELNPIASGKENHFLNNNHFKQKYITRTKKSFSEGNGGCLDLFVPKTPYRKAVLYLKIRFDKLYNYEVDTYKNVTIQHNGNIIVIQTDKPLYRGGEKVMFRVIQLKNDLSTLNTQIYKISIEGPSEIFGNAIKIMQWYNSSTNMGVLQKEHKLDKYAPKGEWHIIAETGGPNAVSVEQKFYVADYALPRFNIHVDYHKNVLLTFRTLTWNICVKYSHGEPMLGLLKISVKSDVVRSKIDKFETYMNGSSSCLDHVVDTNVLGFGNKMHNKPKLIIADISFKELDTGMWKNHTTISKVKYHAVEIEFVDKHKKFYAPAISRKVYLRVTNWEEKIVPYAKVRLCVTLPTNSQRLETIINECTEKYTNYKGIATLSFMLPLNYNSDYINLKASVFEHPFLSNELIQNATSYADVSITLNMNRNNFGYNMEIGQSISKVFSARLGPIRAFPIFLKLRPEDVVKRLTIHYLVITRAGTLFHWGISSQCVNPMNDTQNDSNSIETECSDQNYAENEIYTTMLQVKVTHQMCPYSYLIVYFMTSRGKLIVADKKINSIVCFPNRIIQRWIPNKTTPANVTTLQLSSTKEKEALYCMVGVKNVALNQIAPAKSVQDDILDKINYFMESRRNNIILDENLCFQELNDKSELKYYSDILDIFYYSGLTLSTDMIPGIDRCSNINDDIDNQLGEISDVSNNKKTKERVYFPETWLWEAHSMNSSGILEIPVTVPDDITTWDSQAYCIGRSGFAVSFNAQLQVLKPFFIDLITPKSIKRGETGQIIFKLYNHLKVDLPIKVDIKATSKQTISLEDNGEYCVSPEENFVIYFNIKGEQLKVINLTATVNVVNNKGCPEIKNKDVYNNYDKIVRQIKVLPEGFPVEIEKSAFICTDEQTNQTEISWVFERVDSVNNSESMIVSFAGDIAGPMTLNTKNLLSMPTGCGEQNMALIAYNVVTLEYLTMKKQATNDAKNTAMNNLLSGYERQLNYRRSDNGAFSAFGNDDESGSTWLTAFCLKYFSIMYHKWGINIDKKVLEKALKWLAEKQLENGCFQNEGKVFHEEMKGGLLDDTSNIALASYVAISLIDSKMPSLKPAVIENLLFCLTALKPEDDNRKVYTFALAVLAQIKIEKYRKQNRGNYKFTHRKGNENEFRQNLPNVNFPGREDNFVAKGSVYSVSLLKKMAKRKGDMMWWEAESLPVSIETTAYSILSLLEVGGVENVLDAVAAARWLSLHRNQEGGFLSTQDTLVAIEALCALSRVMPNNPPSMKITLKGPRRTWNITLKPTDMQNLYRKTIKSINNLNATSELKVTAQGSGCVFIQVTQRYNKHTNPASTSSFGLYAAVKNQQILECDYDRRRCKCSVILNICVSWNDRAGESFPEMAMLKIETPVGYVADLSSMRSQLMEKRNTMLRRIEEEDDARTTHVYLSPTSAAPPGECYGARLTGSGTRASSATVEIYDYYRRPRSSRTTTYAVEPCRGGAPSRGTRSAVDERFLNWTVVDSEADLDLPDGVEGNAETWVAQ